jgi:hypothetical protein
MMMNSHQERIFTWLYSAFIPPIVLGAMFMKHGYAAENFLMLIGLIPLYILLYISMGKNFPVVAMEFYQRLRDLYHALKNMKITIVFSDHK